MADVAKRAGVSRALVSIVMRNEPGASPENRERVWQAAKELDYRPNIAAQMLRRTRTKHLGIVYTMAHGLDADLVEALYPVAEEAGFSLALGVMTATRGWRRAAEELLEFRCEALIVIAPEDDPRGFAEVAHAAPLIAVGRRINGVDSVHIDDPATSRLAVDHLVGLGHRRIVHVDGGSQPGATGRRKGYLDAMRAHGLEEFAHVEAGDYSEESGARAGARLLQEKVDFTAVAAANDRMAIGVISSLTSEGLRVPDEVSIVGTDDSALARMSHRNLTSVSQRAPALAKHVVDLAINRIGGSLEPSADMVVDPELVIRSSTAPPPVRAAGQAPWTAPRPQRVAATTTPLHRPVGPTQDTNDGATAKPSLPDVADPFKISFD
jgi:DNA-binding LacI/PurR family transcriptional regulator